MLELPRMRRDLLRFMNDHLLDISKEEIRLKTLSKIKRFKSYYEDHSCELFSHAMTNNKGGNKLRLWMVGEVRQLIEKMTARIIQSEGN